MDLKSFNFGGNISSLFLKENQAAIAAFFSACFLVFADSPLNLIPASSTVQENVGTWPGPDLTLV